MKNKRLVCIPGPTPVVRSIQDQMARETVAFGDPGFVKDYKELIEDLKVIFDCSGEVFPLAGTGTLAMEMAIANNTKSGDNILIVSHGFFGDRFIDLCERKGLNVDIISSEWGKVVCPKDIEKKLQEKDYAAITVTHVDTATGVVAPIKEIGEVVKKFENTLYIVDGVCATAAEEEYVDSMGIDVLLTGSQKAFGVSPGLLLLFAGKKSLERRVSLGRIPEFYCDYEKWIPIMDNPAKYFATPAVNLIWAMQELVRLIKEEGIANRYERHRKNAKAMQAAIESLGFTILAGEYARVPGPLGRTMIDPNTFALIERPAFNIMNLITAVPRGFIDGANVVILVFMIGGSFGVIKKTGIIEIGVHSLTKKFSKKGIIVIPILFAVFAVVASFIGGVELCLIYIPILMPLLLGLGFDSMVTVGIALCATAAGYTAALTNPFTIGIGHEIGVLYMTWYGKRVKNNPKLSLVYEEDLIRRKEIENSTAIVPMIYV